MLKRCLLALAITVAAPLPVALAAPAAVEPVDLEMVTRIRAEAFHNSQLMDHLTHLTECLDHGLGPLEWPSARATPKLAASANAEPADVADAGCADPA